MPLYSINEDDELALVFSRLSSETIAALRENDINALQESLKASNALKASRSQIGLSIMDAVLRMVKIREDEGEDFPLQCVQIAIKMDLAKFKNPDENYQVLHRWMSSAIEYRSPEVIGALIDAGVDPNQIKGGTHFLAQAMKRGDGDVFNILIEKGADPNAQLDEKTVDYPVWRECLQASNRYFLGAMIDGGARVDTVVSRGWTALHTCTISSDKYTEEAFRDVFKRLTDHGVDPRAKNEEGLTFGQLALNMGQKVIANIEDDCVAQWRAGLLDQGTKPASRTTRSSRL